MAELTPLNRWKTSAGPVNIEYIRLASGEEDDTVAVTLAGAVCVTIQYACFIVGGITVPRASLTDPKTVTIGVVSVDTPLLLTVFGY